MAARILVIDDSDDSRELIGNFLAGRQLQNNITLFE